MTTHLPETHRTPEGLREALTSAQLQQSMNSLTQAIHSDQLPVLLSGLGLNAGALHTAQPGTDALEVLCRAMDSQNGGAGASGGSLQQEDQEVDANRPDLDHSQLHSSKCRRNV